MGSGGDNSREKDLSIADQQLLKKQTSKQRPHVQRPSGQKEVGPHPALCCTRKATPRAQQKADWHPGTCPEETVREDVGILGG